ncbi:MAG: DUF438 domain-containing protein [Kiritimatiellia bacterium]
MKEIMPQTTIHDLIEEHPELLNFLASYRPEFQTLGNAALRASMGQVATLERVAAMAGVPVEQLIADIHKQLSGSKATILSNDASRLERLKRVIRALHEGGSVEQLRAEFVQLLQETDPTEIARLEEELIREGMPVEAIHRLCDLHVNLFRHALEQQAESNVPAWHPIHTYRVENKEIRRRAEVWSELCRHPELDSPERVAELSKALEALAAVELHYRRKENQLFPYLERKDFAGPAQVMWAVHDDVRRLIKELGMAIQERNAEDIRTKGIELARVVTEMMYKEEKILFPNSLRLLSEEEWRSVRRGEDEIGYILGTPPPAPSMGGASRDGSVQRQPLIQLSVGALTLEQLDRMLVSLPFEFSFVDHEDTVRFYSGHTQRIFPRSPGVIGRKVQNCHPPKSLAQVNAILKAFRAGTRDRAEFWINYHGRFLYIIYSAVRSPDGRYLGTVEATLDATRIRQLEGERRLLQWDTPNE